MATKKKGSPIGSNHDSFREKEIDMVVETENEETLRIPVRPYSTQFGKNTSSMPIQSKTSTVSDNTYAQSTKPEPPTKSEKKNILIIEDSPAVSFLIQEFLKKLGYDKINICASGKIGVKVFGELVKSGKMPIVFLDYSLPDMDGSEVMSKIFSDNPEARVIIESASDKYDESIKNVLRGGAYEYLEKPIRFDNLKNIMNVLEEEDKIISSKKDHNTSQIDSLLKSSARMSLARISEYSGIDKDDALSYLKDLRSEGKIVETSDIKEVSCSLCDSVKIGQTFHCPSCNTSNFRHAKLIEHYKCGNITPEETYENNMCPKCRKEIKILGVDYKTLENYYVCNECNDKFPEPAHEYLCLRCNHKFALTQAKWTTSAGFHAIKL